MLPPPSPDDAGVDSSAPAISLAAENAKLNGLQDKVEFVRGDISAVMKAELQVRERDLSRAQGWLSGMATRVQLCCGYHFCTTATDCA